MEAEKSEVRLATKFKTDMGIDLPEIPENDVLKVLDWNTDSEKRTLNCMSTNISKMVAESDETKKLAALMCNTMYAEQGIGLAGVQVNVPLNIFVMDCSYDKFGYAPRVILNPSIVETIGDKVKSQEGCLSVPGFSEEIDRYQKIRVQGKDLNWEDVEYIFEGLEAFCAQHEMDHLNGRCCISYSSLLKQDMYSRKVKKIKRKAKMLAEQYMKYGDGKL